MELKSKALLESLGYEVVRVAGSKGSWDLLALNSHEIRLIQVRSNRDVSKVEKEILQGLKYPICVSKELWTWVDYRRQPRIEIL